MCRLAAEHADIRRVASAPSFTTVPPIVRTASAGRSREDAGGLSIVGARGTRPGAMPCCAAAIQQRSAGRNGHRRTPLLPPPKPNHAPKAENRRRPDPLAAAPTSSVEAGSFATPSSCSWAAHGMLSAASGGGRSCPLPGAGLGVGPVAWGDPPLDPPPPPRGRRTGGGLVDGAWWPRRPAGAVAAVSGSLLALGPGTPMVLVMLALLLACRRRLSVNRGSAGRPSDRRSVPVRLALGAAVVSFPVCAGGGRGDPAALVPTVAAHAHQGGRCHVPRLVGIFALPGRSPRLPG